MADGPGRGGNSGVDESSGALKRQLSDDFAAGRTPQAWLRLEESLGESGGGLCHRSRSAVIADDGSDVSSVPLVRWMSAHASREEQMRSWLRDGPPRVIWLAAILSPQAMLSALKQDALVSLESDRVKQSGFGGDTSGSAAGMPASKLTLVDLQLAVVPTDAFEEGDIKSYPSRALLMGGLVIEGAQWSSEERTLSDLPLGGRVHRVHAPLVAVVARAVDESARLAREGNLSVTQGLAAADGSGGRRAGRGEGGGAAGGAGGSPFDSYRCPLYKSPARGKTAMVTTISMTTRD